ncbi:methyltransferase domain-containing protein [Chloroflexota bacterium]
MKRKRFYQNNELGSDPMAEPRIWKVRGLLRKEQQAVDKFLDIGCFDGTISHLFGSVLKAKEIYGIDNSSKAIKAAKKTGIKAYELDIDKEDLPFEDNSFDAIFCGEVIEHLFDPDNLLDEVYRVLKPGGFCIITTPNLAGWRNRLVIIAGFQPYFSSASLRNYNVGKLTLGMDSGAGREHIRNFTLRGLKGLLRLHNFKIKRVIGSGLRLSEVIPLKWGFPVILAEKLMAMIPSLATCLIVEVEKPSSD